MSQASTYRPHIKIRNKAILIDIIFYNKRI